MHYIHRFKLATIEKIVGLFVLLAVIALVSIWFFTMRGRVFEEVYHLKAIFSQGYELKPGALVVLSGIEVGVVESVQFNEANKVEIILSIDKSFQRRIRKDSVATITKKGLVGDKIVSLSIGGVDFPILSDGDFIKSQDSSDMQDIADETKLIIEDIRTIVKNIKEAGFLEDIKKVTEKINDPLDRLSMVLRNLEEITKSINEKEGSLGTLIKDKKLYHDIEESVQLGKKTIINIGKSADDIKKLSSQLLKSGKKVTSDMEIVSSNMKNISVELEKIIALLPHVVKESEEGIREARKVIEAAKKIWLIRKHLPKEKEVSPEKK